MTGAPPIDAHAAQQHEPAVAGGTDLRRRGRRREEDADRPAPGAGKSAGAGRSHEDDLTRLGARLREVEPERSLGGPRGQGGNGERGESKDK